MRALLLCACALLLAAEAEPWSGHLRIEEVELLSEAAPAERQNLDDLIAEFRRRIADLEEAVQTPALSGALEEGLLQQDLLRYRDELEALLQARGGSIPRGQYRFSLHQAPVGGGPGGEAIVRALLPDLAIYADHGRGTAILLGSGKRQEVPLAKLAAAPASSGPPGEPLQGAATILTEIRSGGHSYAVRLAPGLPNPYALSLPAQGQDDQLYAALARLMGLPVEVSRASQHGRRVWRVVALQAEDLAAAALQPPPLEDPP